MEIGDELMKVVLTEHYTALHETVLSDKKCIAIRHRTNSEVGIIANETSIGRGEYGCDFGRLHVGREIVRGDTAASASMKYSFYMTWRQD